MEVHPGLCQGVIKTDTKSLLPRVPVPFGGSLQGPMTCSGQVPALGRWAPELCVFNANFACWETFACVH